MDITTSKFWSNTIWFILLGLSTVAELTIALKKAKDRKRALAVYLSVSGITFCLEMIIYSYFKAYSYYPMLFPQSPPDDSIAGNLFSQLSISATALLISVLNLRYYWFAVFAAVYVIIEEAFLALDIYKHNWYRTWMTAVGLLVIFWTAKKIYKHVSTNRITDFWHYALVFLGLVTLHQHTIVWVFRLTGIREFSETLLRDAERSIVVLSAANMLVLGVTIMILYFSSVKFRWKTPVILLLYAMNYFAVQLHLMQFKEGWFLVATTICIFGMYLYTYMMDKLYGGNG